MCYKLVGKHGLSFTILEIAPRNVSAYLIATKAANDVIANHTHTHTHTHTVNLRMCIRDRNNTVERKLRKELEILKEREKELDNLIYYRSSNDAK